MNILYSCDNNYVQHVGASLYSLLNSNRLENTIDIYLIDHGISETNRTKLSAIASEFDKKINYIPIGNLINKIHNKDDFPISGYSRLFISEYLVNVDKIIYLDADTIINGSLRELWEEDINKFYVAGVEDNPARFMKEIVGMNNNTDKYINSGVMVMNLKLWREEKIEEKVLLFMKIFDGKVPHHDQGVINGVCKGKIKILHPKFNCMSQFFLHSSKQIKLLSNLNHYYSEKQLKEAIKSPIVIHYITKFYGRPWELKCSHPYKFMYKININETGFKDFEMEKSKNDLKLSIRKKIFYFTPFVIYMFVEKILNHKRFLYYQKNFKSIKGEK